MPIRLHHHVHLYHMTLHRSGSNFSFSRILKLSNYLLNVVKVSCIGLPSQSLIWHFQCQVCCLGLPSFKSLIISRPGLIWYYRARYYIHGYTVCSSPWPRRTPCRTSEWSFTRYPGHHLDSAILHEEETSLKSLFSISGVSIFEGIYTGKFLNVWRHTVPVLCPMGQEKVPSHF